MGVRQLVEYEDIELFVADMRVTNAIVRSSRSTEKFENLQRVRMVSMSTYGRDASGKRDLHHLTMEGHEAPFCIPYIL